MNLQREDRGNRIKSSKNAEISKYAKLYGDVYLEDGVILRPFSVIYGPAKIEKGAYIDSFTIIGYPSKNEMEKILAVGKKPWEKESETVIGANSLIRSHSVIYSNVKIGRYVKIGHNTLIRECTQIGDYSVIGSHVVVDGFCEIGSNVSIQTGVYISQRTYIKDSVFLGPRCVLINDKYMMQKEYELRGPTIEKGASIGANSVIFPSVEIGEGSVIGAGSLVRQNIPRRKIAYGTPAKPIRDVPEDWKSVLLKR